MAMFFQNVRFGWRTLTRNQGFAVAAVLALALGIGPNVAIFSIIYATFLAPMPYQHPEQLAVVWTTQKGERIPSTANTYLALRDQAHSFQALSFSAFDRYSLTSPDHVDLDITGSGGTGDSYWEAPMLLGRNLQASDSLPGHDHVVVLQNRLWREYFHADRTIVGKPLRINDELFTVVGVTGPSIADREGGTFGVPLVLTPGAPNLHWGFIFARLKPGVTLHQAQAELSTLQAHVPRQGGTPPLTLQVDPLRNDWLSASLQRNLWLLLAAVGFVLLIACANLANLLLARGASRQRELAVRVALGATSRQIFTQLLTESFALVIAGGALGCLLGWGLLHLILAVLPEVGKSNAEAVVEINLPVLLFGLGASLLAGLVAGCAPAFYATRQPPIEVLKQTSANTTGSASSVRTQRLLMAGEFALALTLLGGAAMTLHSFYNLTNVDLGVRTDGILTAQIGRPPSHASTAPANPAQVHSSQQLLLDRLHAIPGVRAAALTTTLPLDGHDSFPFSLLGHPAPPNAPHTADMEAVSPGFFSVFDARLMEGRLFTPADTDASTHVAVVSQSFVRHFLPGLNPLDQTVQFALPSDSPSAPPAPLTSWRIVGVFHDIRNGNQLSDEATPELYVPLAQISDPSPAVALRTSLPPGSLTPTLRTVLAQTLPGFPFEDVSTFQALVDHELSPGRFYMLLFGGFALLALSLAALGIYGVISFNVAQRTHEIGLRIALGARPSDILWMISRDTLRLSLIGIALGLAGMITLGRLLGSSLYGVAPLDLGAFAAVALLLTATALLASSVPAQRAARTNPTEALRQD